MTVFHNTCRDHCEIIAGKESLEFNSRERSDFSVYFPRKGKVQSSFTEKGGAAKARRQ